LWQVVMAGFFELLMKCCKLSAGLLFGLRIIHVFLASNTPKILETNKQCFKKTELQQTAMEGAPLKKINETCYELGQIIITVR
jgi:hypothetical protein